MVCLKIQTAHQISHVFVFRAVCGAPRVDWKTAADKVAPAGWTASGFNGHIFFSNKCDNGWNAYANRDDQGQLYAMMKGYGLATVKYRDCWGEGFVGLYLNGQKIDNSSTVASEPRTYRCS